jgi:hypothetical protein
MTFRRFLRFVTLSSIVLVLSATFCPTLHAQVLLASAPLPDAPVPSNAPTPFIEAAPPVVIAQPNSISEHKFWDRQNSLLLIGAAASNGADFAVTRANLQSGGQELNPVVRMFGRSTPGLAANFIGETAGIVSLSYFFHKTGHHKLERAVPMVNIGGSLGAVAFGLMHR